MSRRRKVWLSLGAIFVLWLADFVYASWWCYPADVIVFNSSGSTAKSITLRNVGVKSVTVWKGRLESFRAVKLTVPILYEGSLVIDVVLENGVRPVPEGSDYVTSLHSNHTTVFTISRDVVHFDYLHGSLFVNFEPDGFMVGLLEFADTIFDITACPALYLWHSVENP